MGPLARRIARLAGWRRWGAAALAGALLTLALPPFYLVPLAAVSFTVLVWQIDGLAGSAHRWRAALALGWWFGFAHFVTGLYWIANALLVDAARFGWLVPFAVAGLSLYFALFPAAAVLIAAWARPGWARVLALAAAWAATEALRGTVLTGFAWNTLATVLAFAPALIQGAAVVGAYGLSLAVVFAAAAPATLAGPAGAGPAVGGPRGVALALAVTVIAGGAARLALGPKPGAADPSAARLRVVQAGIDQRLKWRPELARAHFGTYVALSRRPAGPGAPAPGVVIWPETAIPFVYDGDSRFTRALAAAVPPGGLLITGVVRRAAATATGAAAKIWNSVIAVDGKGALVARYDKHHLVPFGEYVPLRRFNPFPKITEGRADFSAGPGPRTLALPGLPPVSPLVCYEAIFPGAVTAPGPRPGWLLNLTNDAWFGRSTGPYQHLAAARLRAVEEGLPLIRAANTGISAVIDPLGRVTQSLGLGARGVIDAALPAAVGATVFSRLGNAGFWTLVAAIGMVVVGCGLGARRG